MLLFSLQAKADWARSVTFLYRSAAALHSPGGSWIPGPKHEWQSLLGGAFKLCEVRTVSKWCALWEAAGHAAQQHSCVSVFFGSSFWLRVCTPNTCSYATCSPSRYLGMGMCVGVCADKNVFGCGFTRDPTQICSNQLDNQLQLSIISATTGRRSKNTNWPSGVNSCESKGHICTQPL